jgi:tRNA A37 threonylcarbamoyladenosine modification protein TsaB
MECLARSISTSKNIGVVIKAYPEHLYLQWYDKNFKALTEPQLKNINDKFIISLKNEDFVLVGNGCDVLAKKYSFQGKIFRLESPLSVGIINSVKKALDINKFQPPDPLYLRQPSVQDPVHWKNSPIIK